jgi:predicted TIM-barrel fold metal-dependent hydrolase
MKKIDSHFHIGFSGYDTEKLIGYLDEKGIEKCWLLTWEELSPPIESLYMNLSIENLMEAFRQYPDRIVPFYAPDPGSDTIETDLKRLIDAGLKGCGELKVTYRWEDERIERYLEIVSRLGLPLLFHMELPRMHYVPSKSNKIEKGLNLLINGAFNGVSGYYIKKISGRTGIFKKRINRNLQHFPGYLYDFEHLEKRIQQFPELIFIGHGPHYWNNISSKLSPKYVHQKGRYQSFGIIDHLLEKYDNFYCDISGTGGYNALTRDKEKSVEFYNRHYEKLLFGTDNVRYDIESAVHSLGLSSEKLDRIFYENAAKIIPQ